MTSTYQLNSQQLPSHHPQHPTHTDINFLVLLTAPPRSVPYFWSIQVRSRFLIDTNIRTASTIIRNISRILPIFLHLLLSAFTFREVALAFVMVLV